MAEPEPAGPDGLVPVITALVRDWSIEVTPRELRREPDLLSRSLLPGRAVYLTSLANASVDDTVDAARLCAGQGFRPVAHIAARAIANLVDLDTLIGRLVDNGCRDVLVVAGSIGRPVGDITDSMQVLSSGILERRGIETIGVAGHPEGSPDVPAAAAMRALHEKNDLAVAQGIEMYLLTQFAFDGAPVVAWAERIRAEGIVLPVTVGLPGLSTPSRLLRFGISCGVGPSLTVLRKQPGGLLRLGIRAGYHPDQTVVTLADAIWRQTVTSIERVHFFPFGAVETTARWATAIERGDFRRDGSALEPTGRR